MALQCVDRDDRAAARRNLSRAPRNDDLAFRRLSDAVGQEQVVDDDLVGAVEEYSRRFSDASKLVDLLKGEKGIEVRIRALK